jgi:hypothetical protein
VSGIGGRQHAQTASHAFPPSLILMCLCAAAVHRCSQDLVEVPSHLWEHFSAAPQSLAVLARHKGSRESMPAKLSEVLCRGWSSFSSVTPALELQQQVWMAVGPQIAPMPLCVWPCRSVFRFSCAEAGPASVQ